MQMPYTLELRDETVIWLNMYGELTVEEIAALNQEVVDEYLGSGDQKYYIVYDLTQLERFPTNVRKVSDATIINQSENVSYEIICGIKNPLIDFLARIISNTFGRTSRLKRFSTENEVSQFIERSKR